MMIDTMPEVLTWSPAGAEVMQRVHAAYLELLVDRLGATLAIINRDHPGCGDRLAASLRSLGDKSLARLLTAPETSYRLLWPRHHTVAAIERFLDRAAAAEAARAGDRVVLSSATWTALGDACFGPGKTTHVQPQLAGMMPIDFGSPWALGLDLDGHDSGESPIREPLDDRERERACSLLAMARDCIARVDPGICTFVAVFTKVLIVQRDPAAPEVFSSGSSGQYVGRSYLANTHLDRVDEVVVADGLIHEAIHSLLYMQEQKKAWVNDDALYGPTIRTVSPWTNNPLPLRPYLQAAFVWFGLLQFFTRALAVGAFPRERAIDRIQTAARGFLGQPLVDQIAPWRDGLADDVVAAVECMQQQVVCSVEAAG